MPDSAGVQTTDPVELAVFSNLIAAIPEEACGTLERTAYTTFVKETNDFSVALATPRGSFFAYPRRAGVPQFVGLPLEDVVQAIAQWHPGDVLFTNDPYSTGGLVTHAPDLNLVAPIFYEDQLIAFCWGFVHSSDVGGAVPGSIAPSNREIYQEGFRVPPQKLYRGGNLNEDLLQIIKTNVRTPDQVWGDMKAVLSAFHVATARLQDIFQKYGAKRANEFISSCLNYSEAKTRAVIAQIPPGTYRFVDYLDDDVVSKFPIRICLSLTASGSDVHLDFTGTDPQVLAAFNLATAGKKAHGWLTLGLLQYLLTEDPQIPINAGVLRPIRVTAPPGTLVHAIAPASVGARLATGVRILEMTFGALTQAIPNKLPAAGSGQGMLPVVSMPAATTGARKVNVLQPVVGGTGGRPAADGYDGTDWSMSFLKNTPIEIIETELDVLVHRYFYSQDSAGPGKFRGGLGVGLTVETLAPDTVLAMRGMERTRFAPWGVHGGHAGAMTRPAVINAGRPDERRIPKVDVLRLEPGDVLELVSSGGGGYGDPCERDVHLVARDVLFGYVSREMAESAYGVVFEGASNEIDAEATKRCRQSIAKARVGDHPIFSFGSARLDYERVWTSRAYDELHSILSSLPLHSRAHAKRAIMEEVCKSPGYQSGHALEPDDIRRAWTDICGKPTTTRATMVAREGSKRLA